MERWQQLEEIFHEALHRDSAQRAAAAAEAAPREPLQFAGARHCGGPLHQPTWLTAYFTATGSRVLALVALARHYPAQ